MDYSKFEPDFLLVPYKIIDKVDPSAQRVYGVIYALQQLSLGKCLASNETLARFAHTSERSVERAVSDLLGQEFIKVSYKDAEKKHRSYIIATVTYGGQKTLTDTHGGLDRQGWRSRPTPVATYKEYKKEDITTSEKNKFSPSSSAQGREKENTQRGKKEIEEQDISYVPADEDGVKMNPWRRRRFGDSPPEARNAPRTHEKQENVHRAILKEITSKTGKSWVTAPKQFKAINQLREAGWDAWQIVKAYEHMHTDTKWPAPDGDLLTLITYIEKGYVKKDDL